MSPLGRGISSWAIVATLLAAGGTAGTTVAFQDVTQDLRAENDALRAENEELRHKLTEARKERQAAQTRAAALNDQLQTRNEDVKALVSELERKEKVLNASQRLAASQRAQTNMSRAEMERRLNYLCAQRVNRDKFGCQQFGPDT